jgi:uncharacterized protein YaaN involved in tellurite resistance
MADNQNFNGLTLNPDLSGTQVPSPSAEPIADEAALALKKARDMSDVQLDETVLSDEDKKAVEEFSKQIDLTDSSVVLQYGAAAQKKVADFSQSALENVRTKDLGAVGDVLSGLVSTIKDFTPVEEQKKGFFGIFSRGKASLSRLRARYGKAEETVDKIAELLENHQVTLLKDVAMFDKLYEMNIAYYKELTMYILAGKKKLQEVREKELEPLRQHAIQTNKPEDAQRYNDLAELCNRFEKRLNDLALTRAVSVQMGPQTRLLQNNDALIIEKIQTSLVNTIPLWKSQMVLALGIEHSRQATAAQSAVTNATNELLKKNAELLRSSTVETAKEAERSIVELETLQYTSQQLISTLDDVLQIQREGAAKRRETEAELALIEADLKQKLLELRG